MRLIRNVRDDKHNFDSSIIVDIGRRSHIIKLKTRNVVSFNIQINEKNHTYFHIEIEKSLLAVF